MLYRGFLFERVGHSSKASFEATVSENLFVYRVMVNVGLELNCWH